MHKNDNIISSRILLIFICFAIFVSVQSTVHEFIAFSMMACNIRCKHGSCRENQLPTGNNIACKCGKGWTGHFCDISTGCELKCGNGKCVFKDGTQFCKCPHEYDGTLCEIRHKTSSPIQDLSLTSADTDFSMLEENAKKHSSQCAGNFVCQNGGYCAKAFLGYKCQCTFPYTGVFCDELCDKKCSNGGKCFRQVHYDGNYDTSRVTFQCMCPMGFQGEMCEINIFPDYN